MTEGDASMQNIVQGVSSEADRDRGALWRDLGVIVLVVPFAGWLFARLELSESVFALTRQWESLQIDELPVLLFVLASCLAWFAWRRYREARAEVIKRQAAEERLAALLLENRRLARQYLQGQEAERKALARELHDELGQYVNAIKTDAVSIQEKVADGPPSIALASSAIVRHTDHLHAVVRDLIRELRPVALDDLGLRAALEHYLEHCQQRMPRVQFAVFLEGDLDGLDEPVSLAIYRSVQEGVTNVSRHAAATRLEIRIRRAGSAAEGSDAVTLDISDDGRGADPGESPSGLGLIGMRERVEMLGGRLGVTTAPGLGFSIAASIPVHQATT
jgi:two-component system, NarL family, sensor histidine kinase UhpB